MSLLSLAYDLASFGAAGLMGTMWLWERKLSRAREEQLSASHARILRDEERLGKLVSVVEHNTAAVTGFAQTQRQVTEALRDLVKELRYDRAK